MRLIDVLKDDRALIETMSAHADMEITGLTCDSRAVRPGFLFAALPGVKVDGRDYISAAVEKGAVCILAPVGIKAEVVTVEDQNPRLRFAKMAANFYERQPENVAAVTGTNGKTSVATFLRQIWSNLGEKAVSIGTIGLYGERFAEPGRLTTPDPVKLHESLQRVVDAGINHLAMEASSHGIEQYRLDGVKIKAAAFTNITRDHLDYHGTMNEYLLAKMRLFSEVVEDGGSVVVNADVPESKDVIEVAKSRGLNVFSYGHNGENIRLVKRETVNNKQRLSLEVLGHSYEVMMPLPGAFQAENALCALGLALSFGADVEKAVMALKHLEGVSGRMECVGHVNGADVYVDYAHTPDAMEHVLKALRPHTKNKLYVMFGCGGDRDAGKRPQMGRIAAEFSDQVIITDDNPRSEDAGEIRKQILAAATGAIEIGDRHLAIQDGIKGLREGDVIVLTGKGHEQGQYIGDEVLPFSDVIEAKTTIWEMG